MQASLVISISLALWMDTLCGGSVLISKYYHIYYIDPISKSECGMRYVQPANNKAVRILGTHVAQLFLFLLPKRSTE